MQRAKTVYSVSHPDHLVLSVLVFLETSEPFAVLVGTIFDILLSLFTASYSVNKRDRGNVFMQGVHALRLDAVLAGMFCAIATDSFPDLDCLDLLWVGLVEGVIRFFYSESRVLNLPDVTPLTPSEPQDMGMVVGWALRSLYHYYRDWLERGVGSKPLERDLKGCLQILNFISVPMRDTEARASVSSDFVKSVDRGKLRLPVMGLLHIFQRVHHRFHALVNMRELVLHRSMTLIKAQEAICSNRSYLLLFSKLIVDCPVVATLTDSGVQRCWENLLVKFLHVRDAEYLGVFLNYDVEATQALRSSVFGAVRRARSSDPDTCSSTLKLTGEHDDGGECSDFDLASLDHGRMSDDDTDTTSILDDSSAGSCSDVASQTN